MAKITFEDKQAVRASLELPKNKLLASDLNEIKASVNALYDNGSGAIASTFGWAIYSDSAATSQTIGTTPVKLLVNGLGSATNTTYKPTGYVGEMWDTANNKILAETVGDSFDLRLDLTINAKSSNPNRITMKLDIGGGASPSIVIVERDSTVQKTTPFTIDIGIPIFSLDTFVANGGQIFLEVDTGTVTVTNRSVFLKRDFSPPLQGA